MAGRHVSHSASSRWRQATTEPAQRYYGECHTWSGPQPLQAAAEQQHFQQHQQRQQQLPLLRTQDAVGQHGYHELAQHFPNGGQPPTQQRDQQQRQHVLTCGTAPCDLISTQPSATALDAAAGQQPALSASYMAAEPAAEPGSPPSPGAPWSMPTKFLPPPESFIPEAGAAASKVIDLRQKSHAQLLAMAAKHNKRLGLPDDPFQAVLAGIPDRAKLRPDSKVASTFTLGSVPTDSPYAKAWRAIKRPAPRGSAKSSAADAVAAKRAEAAATAARLAKLQAGGNPAQQAGSSAAASAAAAAARHGSRQQHQELPPEQSRWRSKLSAFLGRPVDVPPLAPGAPVLDMNRLFLEVMSQGGFAKVTAQGSWPALAASLQRDAELGDLLAAVYDCYLHPLELDLPLMFRPARNVDHLESQTKLRGQLGCRCATYEGVVYAADRAAAALSLLAQYEQQDSNHKQQHMHEQQQSQQQQQEACSQNSCDAYTPLANGGAAGIAAAPASRNDTEAEAAAAPPPPSPAAALLTAQSSLAVVGAVELLHDAAVLPEIVVGALQQQGLSPGLHGPSQAACVSHIRRTQMVRRASRGRTAGGAAAGAAAARAAEEEEDDLLDELLAGAADAVGAPVMAGALPASSALLDTADTAAAAAAAGHQQLDAAASAGEQQPDRKDSLEHRAAGQMVQQHDSLGGTSTAATANADISATDTGTSSHHAVDVAAADGIAAPCLDGKLHTGVAAEQPGLPAPDASCSPGRELQVPKPLQTWQGCEISKVAAAGHAAPAMLQLDAARWLLLSKRALQSGPPGCDKPIAVLPGAASHHQQQLQHHGSGGSSRHSLHKAGEGKAAVVASGTVQEAVGGITGKRAFLGITPKCGSCRTCLNPSMKKACVVNRERIGQGLDPVLPGHVDTVDGDAAEAMAMTGT